MSIPILDVRGLAKHFGSTEALHDVSFRVEAGELFGLLGPNGAGKTTLLSILACLSDPTAGDVFFSGKPLIRSDLRVRREIGIGTQDLSVYGELTARENLVFFARLYGIRGVELNRRVEEVLELTGLKEHASQRVATFSGGMKRRLNLGAAIVHNPRLLLLDEPTTGVDPQSRNHIFERIRELNAAGLTIIYTSHYMEEVQSL
jgi:ABC-2 type transport system ATP-binding protein